jgi:BirA family biotin operon repressor/biotin-[acetyl-CoA-carboxylase] ligase
MNMIETIINPWNAPVYHLESCDSTMDEAQRLEQDGAPHGTVIAADFQRSGRGRLHNRRWESSAGENLLFTVLLRYKDLSAAPNVITLRTGLAVQRAITKLPIMRSGEIKIKWPNDIMLNGKKICGILTKSDGANVFIGIGVNVAQRAFNSCSGAASILAEADVSPDAVRTLRYSLLESTLSALRSELETHSAAETWNGRINEILFMKDKSVIFFDGNADNATPVKGILTGVSADGAVIIVPETGIAPKSFFTGELGYLRD